MECHECGSQLSSKRLSCPNCHQLVYQSELTEIAARAEDARRAHDVREELGLWRRALELLPQGSRQYRSITERASLLSREVEKLPVSGAASEAPDNRNNRNKPNGPNGAKGWKFASIGALGLVLWKLKAVLAFAITKGKFLLAGLTKSGTVFSMLLSLGVYWAAFGWKFGAGIIGSIYVHEMGHVAALHRLGISASAPMFIPGVGAFVRMNQYPVDAREDARVGLAGPIWGLGASLVAYAIFWLSGAPFWAVIAKVGAWINLFNLLPVWQLDGARGFRALSRNARLVVTILIGALWFWTAEGLLVLLLLASVWQTWRADPEQVGDRTALVHFVVLLVALSVLTTVDVPLP